MNWGMFWMIPGILTQESPDNSSKALSFVDSNGPVASSALIPSHWFTLFLMRDEDVLILPSLEFLSFRPSLELSSLPLWLLKPKFIKMIREWKDEPYLHCECL